MTASRHGPSKCNIDDQSSHHSWVSSMAKRGSTGRGASSWDGNQVSTKGT